MTVRFSKNSRREGKGNEDRGEETTTRPTTAMSSSSHATISTPTML
ncbi:hypothetical protein CCACVL1_29590 [Corchorus capsularis]|uniref:Uncharacterized protein n=1 Tax=Corchorus capsularis TaxID=210143 RepID=A0A1R3G145_COCAP|nr:hypothetical protein CCACVL1_29590 [Corchorus capsularis]